MGGHRSLPYEEWGRSRVSERCLRRDEQSRDVHDGDTGGDAAEGGPGEGRFLVAGLAAGDEAADFDDDLEDGADADGEEDRRPEGRVGEGAEPGAEDSRSAGDGGEGGE